MSSTNGVTLDFNDLSAGDRVSEAAFYGVTISSASADHPVMVFDTANPTGGDSDLATGNLGNVLILSEDGDSTDPDDNASGGTFIFDFAAPVTGLSFKTMDIEDPGYVKFFDADGNVIASRPIPAEGDNAQDLLEFTEFEGVTRMEITLVGSGAIDNVSYTLPDGFGLDGIVEGTEGDDLIDTAYVGDLEGDRIDNGDAIIGNPGSDDDIVEAGAGDDTVFAGEGNDQVKGDTGNDTLNGEAGDDLLDGGAGDDTLDGGAGDDTLLGGDGNDTALGGGGDDVIDTSGTGALPDEGYPGLYDADGATNNDLDTVDGGAGNDIIRTGDDDDVISGGTGNDTIDAGFDDDLVDGGAGDDAIYGGEGNDILDGGNGADVLFGDTYGLPETQAEEGSVTDPALIDGDADLLPDNNSDVLDGGAGNDSLYGQDDDDTLIGGDGNDLLDGGIDDDVLDGGDGDDTLIGGTGEDLMDGGFGSDLFLGGNGGDVVIGGEDPDNGDTDVLDLTGSDVASIAYTDGDPESGTVTFLDGSTLDFSEIENVIPCFTPGTLIATPRGEVRVEELRPGDQVITRDNGIQEIAWTGAKAISTRQLAANPHLKPILVKAGALGGGLPERDMLVSPNHRLLVMNERTELYFNESEVLAAAKHLVGAPGIEDVNVLGLSYIHFMCENHEVVLSNGAWTESFQPGDYSLKGIGNAQRREILDLFPELSTEVGLGDYTAARRSLKKHEARLLVG